MIRKKYEQKQVKFLLSDLEVPFRTEALLNMVNRQLLCFFGMFLSAQV